MTARRTSVGGFTGELVSRVAISGDPTKFRGWEFTFYELLKRTRWDDWIGPVGYKLKPASADRIATEICNGMPWLDNAVLEGEVMPRIETPGEVVRRLHLVESNRRTLRLVTQGDDTADTFGYLWNEAIAGIEKGEHANP